MQEEKNRRTRRKNLQKQPTARIQRRDQGSNPGLVAHSAGKNHYAAPPAFPFKIDNRNTVVLQLLLIVQI